jgi:RNA recognition motif-containing protein
MGKRLYVGNLDVSVGDADLQQMFSSQGTIESAKVVMDVETHQSKGYGIVEMSTEAEALAAISNLNGQDHVGRALKVSEARPKPKPLAVRDPVEKSGARIAPW